MSRPRTVLVHSGLMDPGMWDGFELAGEVVRHHLEDDLAETVGSEPAALVGASYGGLVCLDFAARHPELVTALVLLNAPAPDHEWSGAFIAYAEEEERLIEAGDLEAATDLNLSYWGVGEQHREVVRRSLELDVAEIESVDLGAVRARALVAVGGRDKPDFQAIAERLARELPDAEHVVIEGAGHLPALERQAETSALVRRFLAG